MKRYFVEIDWDKHKYVNPLVSDKIRTTIGMYVFAYSEDQIREMFKTYRLVTVDITE